MQPSPVVLITGATGGIGRALAETFLAKGARVVLAGRDADKLAGLADDLGSLGELLCVTLDVTEPASIERSLAEVQAEFGPVQILINNAGIAISAPLSKGEEQAERHMQVNYHGPRRLIQAILPGMLQAGGGQVVQIASSAGLYGYAYTSAYCASKHALLGYTRAAALELRKKRVGFFSICPHFVESPMTDASIDRIQETTGKDAAQARAALAGMNPDGVLVQPNQIAKIAWEYIATKTSGAIWELTGTGIKVVEEGFSLGK